MSLRSSSDEFEEESEFGTFANILDAISGESGDEVGVIGAAPGITFDTAPETSFDDAGSAGDEAGSEEDETLASDDEGGDGDLGSLEEYIAPQRSVASRNRPSAVAAVTYAPGAQKYSRAEQRLSFYPEETHDHVVIVERAMSVIADILPGEQYPVTLAKCVLQKALRGHSYVADVEKKILMIVGEMDVRWNIAQ